jgi:hypothetical protein
VHDKWPRRIFQVRSTLFFACGLRLLTPSLSFANEISPLTKFEPSPSDYGSLGDTMDPTTLWPASMDNPNMNDQLPPMHLQQPPMRCQQSPIHSNQLPMPSAIPPYDPLPAHRTPFSSMSPFPLAPKVKPSTTAPRKSPTTLPTPTSQGQTSPGQASTPSSSTPSTSPTESDKTRRARYAANQRHSKAQKARHDSAQNETPTETDTRAAERKQRHREKNKVAAAKCRSRQRKQVQTIQEKGARLGEKNAELKAMIQELRRELNELRSLALEHQTCNCNVARYNQGQAERVVAEYRESCLGHSFGGFGGMPEMRSFAQVQ